MATDWKDILGGLSGLPEGGEPAYDATRDDAPDTGKTRKGVTLFYETKGRAGKPATILADFKGVDEKEIDSLASVLKKKLGTGGSVRGGEILIQGDRRQALRQLLREEGFIVKG